MRTGVPRGVFKMASIKTGHGRKKGTNPFEVRVNKKKHIVFGQRNKSIEELSRSTAIRKVVDVRSVMTSALPSMHAGIASSPGLLRPARNLLL